MRNATFVQFVLIFSFSLFFQVCYAQLVPKGTLVPAPAAAPAPRSPKNPPPPQNTTPPAPRQQSEGTPTQPGIAKDNLGDQSVPQSDSIPKAKKEEKLPKPSVVSTKPRT